MAKKPKSIDGLMKHLRDKRNLSISGSTQKRDLRHIGYYHGYKGYRFYNKNTNTIPYTNFSELYSVYNLDANLKSLLYPRVMFIETALKNIVLEHIVTAANSSDIIDIYKSVLDNYKVSGNSINDITLRLRTRDDIYKSISDAVKNKNPIAIHYQYKHDEVPIWGVFEFMSLGSFGFFIKNINQSIRTKISKDIGIRQSDDTNAEMTQKIIFTLKDLRNAIAHNNVIFDNRFKNANVSSSIGSMILNETNIKDVSFNEITDYIILIAFLLKKLKVPKKDIRKFINEFITIVESFRSSVPINIFNKIFATNTKNKVNTLKNFLK